jgi:hypothetical protein
VLKSFFSFGGIMSETPSPHPFNPQNRKQDYERITEFMNGLLKEELVLRLKFPQSLRPGDQPLNKSDKKEWFEFTFHALFKISGLALAGYLKRELDQAESGVVKRRIKNFLRQNGF